MGSRVRETRRAGVAKKVAQPVPAVSWMERSSSGVVWEKLELVLVKRVDTAPREPLWVGSHYSANLLSGWKVTGHEIANGRIEVINANS